MEEDDQTTWDELLHEINHAYRTTPQKSTKISPFLEMFGRSPIKINVDTNANSHEEKREVVMVNAPPSQIK